MRPHSPGTTPAPQPLPPIPRAAPPTLIADCCISSDRSDTPAPPTDCHSGSACCSAPPIPITPAPPECSTTKTSGNCPRSQTLGSSTHLPPGRLPLHRTKSIASAGSPVSTACLRVVTTFPDRDSTRKAFALPDAQLPPTSTNLSSARWQLFPPAPLSLRQTPPPAPLLVRPSHPSTASPPAWTAAHAPTSLIRRTAVSGSPPLEDRNSSPRPLQLAPSPHPAATLFGIADPTPAHPGNLPPPGSARQSESPRPSAHSDTRFHPTSRDASARSA